MAGRESRENNNGFDISLFNVFFSNAAMEKSKKRSAVASSKLGAAEGTNRDGVGDLLDKSQQRNRTQVSKLLKFINSAQL
ncbi:hypothetical protein L1987_21077 [Smallanthus sonchifolius]|uniref:Uncharacterized protein n=1 Tax=Smallanthus sonchifolius TaxID=185202 RepID=A0ACB9IU52_9ASTR|nr:hypothetical protein L1987_21077 [Smallanthus sonchifolius]